MEFFKQWIPLATLYPRTFSRTETSETPITSMSAMLKTVHGTKFAPPEDLESDWECALEQYNESMTAGPALSVPKKISAMRLVLNIFVRRNTGSQCDICANRGF